jgi:hypothetical protein
MILKSDASSDQRILAKTSKTPSPDHPGATRFSAELPWGETAMLDFAEVNLQTATTWCGHIREVINERYSDEAITQRSEQARAERGEERNRRPAEGIVDAKGAVQAPEEMVAVPSNPVEALRQRVAQIDHQVERLEWDIVSATKEKATLLAERGPLIAALEVIDGSNVCDEDGDALPVDGTRREDCGGGGVDGESPSDDDAGGLGRAGGSGEGDHEADDSVDD